MKKWIKKVLWFRPEVWTHTYVNSLGDTVNCRFISINMDTTVNILNENGVKVFKMCRNRFKEIK